MSREALRLSWKALTLSPSPFRTHAFPRKYSTTEATASQDKPKNDLQEGTVFVDSVFPLRLGIWDPRHIIGLIRKETLLEQLHDLVSAVTTNDFRVKSLNPQIKDGGVFVNFQYDSNSGQTSLEDITQQLREHIGRSGGAPSWIGFPRGQVWAVKGSPWREDLKRYVSPAVKITFEGPDVNEETLYNLLRPCGRIEDIINPTPVPAGTLRSSTVVFRQISSAAIARNVIHGIRVNTGSESSPVLTKLRTSYQPQIQAHAIRDYVASHPKIFLPILFFLIGTLTYTIFDPVRIFMVEGKLNDWFDYREFTVYQWLRKNTIERFSLTSPSEVKTRNESAYPAEEVWKERQDAAGALERYLSDLPSTVTFVHGPQGSGKTRLLNQVLKDTKRKKLVIDVRELTKANSEMRLVSGLAVQTGYWPVFSFLNSVNNLIDLASVGLIGQKTGLSSSLSDQLKQVLEVVGTGLRGVNTSYKKHHARELKAQHLAEMRAQHESRVQQRIATGTWHDGRLDCVAGNGVMCELGVGDELFTEQDEDEATSLSLSAEAQEGHAGEGVQGSGDVNETKRKQRSAEDLKAIEALPVVILRNFETKGGGEQRETLMNVLSQWAANIAENQIAHVIVVSDNRENSKLLARALPSKPLNLVQLSDADNASALSFVKQKLHDVDVEVNFTGEQTSYVERLGGRASDLESLIHKVRSGQTVQDAVEDIILRGVSELRKNAFGDDADDAKSLPWTREQAWILMKLLAAKVEVPYHDVLMDYPFKGDETPLRSMEHAELISIVTHNGRPSFIKPGKPVYKFVFERLVGDPIFQATQDISYNNKLIASAESTVKTCEQELLVLKDVEAGTSGMWGSRSAVTQRVEYLLKNMKAAEIKIENLEKQNAGLKKVLTKGG
ncbi:RNA12 protein-domain-containing protein [Cristinia sonorae]|uniref:Mitochondrial escape protein 2 n=1 Tax=Cristinia sonorae TaxID=1940300 RepID=A0A8K0XRU2_9AGAR|nr:RNA12 protein-domain-containing protein [Cristinia sonorae]